MDQKHNIADDFMRNLEELSVLELKELIIKAQALIEKKMRVRKQQAIEELEVTASKYGFNLADFVLSDSKTSGPRNTRRRFVHPENPNLTWVGRGRQPLWFKDLTRRGINPHMETLDQ